MFKRDFILCTAPSVYDFRERSVLFGPVSDMVPSTPIFEMYPLGFTTMSEYFERHGLRCKLYNLASFMLHKKGFDVEANLARLQTRAFGIDLHWMPHCHGTIEVARILKRLHPGVPVIFGGISSSFYHEELIRYDCVDYVFRGDSVEAPELELLRRIRQADLTHTPVGDLSTSPNLTWKDAAGCIHVNPLSWVPDDMDAISMDYAFPMKGVIRDRDFTSYLPTRDWLSYPVCASLTSRGCKRNCVTCGGSAYAYKNHLGRRRVAWRSPELLIRDIETIQRHVPGPMFVLNDFLMAGHDYTHEFIRGLRGKLEQPIGFEFFGPPREGKDFYKLLDDNLPDWSVEISAESYDDEVRTAFWEGPLHHGRAGGHHHRRAGRRVLALRLVLHDRHSQADRRERARHRRVRAPSLRAHPRPAIAGVHQPHGAVPRRGQPRVRRPRALRLSPQGPHSGGAPPAHARALVEADHELRERLTRTTETVQPPTRPAPTLRASRASSASSPERRPRTTVRRIDDAQAKMHRLDDLIDARTAGTGMRLARRSTRRSAWPRTRAPWPRRPT